MKHIIKFLLILSVVLIGSGVFAEPNIPSSTHYEFYDELGLLTEDEKAKFNKEIDQLFKLTNKKLFVAIVKDIGGDYSATFIPFLTKFWNLKSDEVENSLLILIAPRKDNLYLTYEYGLSDSVTALLNPKKLEYLVAKEYKLNDLENSLTLAVTHIRPVFKTLNNVKVETDYSKYVWIFIVIAGWALNLYFDSRQRAFLRGVFISIMRVEPETFYSWLFNKPKDNEFKNEADWKHNKRKSFWRRW